jgi:hypothetical protein
MRLKIDYPHYSISQLQEHERCPRYYYYNRIEGRWVRPVYNLAAGKAMHRGLELHNLELAKGAAGLSVKDMIEIGITHMESAEDKDEMDMPFAKAKDKFAVDGTPPAGKYRTITERKVLEAGDISEEGVEQFVETEIAGHKVVGFLDLVLPGIIVDYKLIGKRKSAAQVERDPQLVLYEHILKRPGSFVQLIKGRETAEFTKRKSSAQVTAGVLAWVADRIEAIERDKKTGVFPRVHPASWVCGPRCPFFQDCFQ